MKRLKIGFYSPYFDTLAGGERYVLTLAGYWSKNHDADVFWDDGTILSKAQERLRIDLSRVKTVPNIFKSGNLLTKLLVSKDYDLIFFLSDGSVPTSLAKHNVLHFQTPFNSVSVHFWKRFDAIVCNSNFTKNNLDPDLREKSIVIYPPVKTDVKISGRKEKLILNVGRFHPWKKQDVLIEAFKKLSTDWRLVCFGGLLPDEESYFNTLKKMAQGYPIKLIPNGSFEELQSLYQKATIYWHAAGFNETDPQRAEHFGISTVEAMAYGCIPIVYDGGGLPEIVEDRKNGYLWKSINDLLEKTREVIKKEDRFNVIKRAKQFDEKIFTSAFDKLLNEKIFS